ncbi:MAG: hypothetical protein IMZ62_03785 [Chloroflexi bacterium]|nr:hypothetical protein [Chloroflexota bacterium]
MPSASRSPGSSTGLTGSLAWDLVRVRHRQGAALVFTSAATIAVGEYALPVYEIYKVGEDVRAIPGLELFADFGLSLSFIPHWNNTDCGADADTSRCLPYGHDVVGMDRFSQWCDMLPPGHTIIGLDEHIGLIIDFEAVKCTVNGISSVTLLRECNPEIYPAGSVFPVEELGDAYCPELPEDGIPVAAWEMVQNAAQAQGPDEAPAEVARLAEERQQARLRKDWAAARRVLRQTRRGAVFGWTAQDSPEGQKIFRQS